MPANRDRGTIRHHSLIGRRRAAFDSALWLLYPRELRRFADSLAGAWGKRLRKPL